MTADVTLRPVDRTDRGAETGETVLRLDRPGW